MSIEALVLAKAKLEAGLGHRDVLAELERQLACSTLPQYVPLMKLAQQAGASLNTVIQQLIQEAQHELDQARKVATAISAARFSARLLLWLPLLTLVFSQIIGLNPLQLLLFKPMGWLLLAIALALSTVAQKWSSQLVRAAEFVEPNTALNLEAVAIGLDAGLSQGAATRLAVLFGFELLPEQDLIKSLHSRSGIPLATLIRVQAQLQRNQVAQKQSLRMAELPQKLMLPTGLLLLPACLCISVVPVALTALAWSK